ncbi:hypothetical protein GCM10027060_26650 [Nesterenkonia halophila]|uniref:zeta toxin family protein n=1 Tax=Nesterenkonia halophila TaxID=302044 RepID=UPI0012908DF7|nr:zeta toxin family protein [Nesterenkonia halophila]
MVEYSQHIQTITDFSKPGQPLAADAPTATINNPEWFRRDTKTGARRTRATRRKLHLQLRREARAQAPGVQQDRRAVVLAGPPGAGKSTVLDDVLGADKPKYLRIDADDFKKSLLEQALQDGSFNDSIKPAELKDHESQTGDRFHPMEMASLVHEESSMLARTMRAEAIDNGENIVVDTVLSSEDSAKELGETLNAAGYQVEVINVEVPYEVSAQRIRERWERDQQKAEQSSQNLGGRWVPSEYARDVYDGPDGKTKSEHAAQQLAENCPAVRRYRVHRTTSESDGAQPEGRWDVDQSRLRRGDPLVSTEVVRTQQRARTAAPARPSRPTSTREGNGRE